MSSSPETAILLLEAKADITWTDKNYQTVVDIAIQRKQIYILSAVILWCLRLLNANRIETILLPYLLKNLSSIVQDYLYPDVGMNSLVETYDKICNEWKKNYRFSDHNNQDLEVKEPPLLQAAKKGEVMQLTQLEKSINRDYLYVDHPLHEEVTQAVIIATQQGKKHFGFVASMAKLLHTLVSGDSTVSQLQPN